MIKKDKMKKQMLKRISALMLTATLCISACPISAMAAPSSTVDNTTGVQSPSVDNDKDPDGTTPENPEKNIKIKEIQVSNKEVVISDNTITNDTNTIGKVEIAISLEGTFNTKKPLKVTYGTSDITKTKTIFYNASTKTFNFSVYIESYQIDEGDYKAGTYEIKALTIDEKEIIYDGDKTLFTLTDNRTDKTAPVLNAVQIYVNDTLQTGRKFTVKKGDIIKVRADVTDDNEVGGYLQWGGSTEGEYYDGVIKLKPSEYDLEGQIEFKHDVEKIELIIYNIEIYDLNNNWLMYSGDEILPFYKEVKVENVGVADATNNALKDVVAKLDELIKLEGALSEYTISQIEQAKKDGKEITADISLATIPEKSIDSEVKEGVQAKAKEALGEDVKLAYLDISLNLLADGSNIGKANKLVEPIAVTVKLPENLKGNYDYKVIRYHENEDGTTEIAVLDTVKNADGTITFKTDRFSTYAIAYSESAETGNGTGTSTGSNSPITGQTGMLALYFAVAVSSLGIFAVSKKRVQK